MGLSWGASVREKTVTCDPNDIAIKSFFLGPRGENAQWLISRVHEVLERWAGWRKKLYPADGQAISPEDQLTQEFLDRRRLFEECTAELLTRFEGEVPKFSPRYIGHMFSEISLPALIGHMVTLLHNPNNLSAESSRIGVQIEDEAVRFLLRMVGFNPELASGHFTSGGTLANFEALTRAKMRQSRWVAAAAKLSSCQRAYPFDFMHASHLGWDAYDKILAELQGVHASDAEIRFWDASMGNPHDVNQRLEELGGHPVFGPVVLVPEHKHYSWVKAVRMFGLGAEALWPVPLDQDGHMCVDGLRSQLNRAWLEKRPVLMVVSVVGSTELGGIDPVDRVQDVLDQWHSGRYAYVWHHVDAAFGGYFRSLDITTEKLISRDRLQALSAISRVHSVTIDPHKLGYVPYSSGAFLVREPRDYCFSSFDDAPYVQFSSRKSLSSVDRGLYTIEGSRSAAGAVATWMTAKVMGLGPDGYGRLIERTLKATRAVSSRLTEECNGIRVAPGCDTNIICFVCAKDSEAISATNQRTRLFYERFSPETNGDFIVSKTTLRWKTHAIYLDSWTRRWSAVRDADEVELIRMCVMNPFFLSAETDVDYVELLIRQVAAVSG